MVHSFTCAGVLPTQYIKMCTFAGVGHVGYGYMKKGNLARITVKHVLFHYPFSVLLKWIQRCDWEVGGGVHE